MTIAKQMHAEHTSAATVIYAVIEKLLEVMFYMQFGLRLYREDE